MIRLAPELVNGNDDYAPLLLEEAKLHLRVDIEDEDDLIIAIIEAAVVHLENTLGIIISEKTWRQSYAEFCDPLRLPFGPVISIESVSYIDSDDDEQTVDSATYRLLTDTRGPKVTLVPGDSWPATAAREDAVTVEFVAGYSNTPSPLRQAIFLLVGHWYENRELMGSSSEMPMAVSALTQTYRPKRF